MPRNSSLFISRYLCNANANLSISMTVYQYTAYQYTISIYRRFHESGSNPFLLVQKQTTVAYIVEYYAPSWTCSEVGEGKAKKEP